MSQLTATSQIVRSAHSGRNGYGVVIVIHEFRSMLCEFHDVAIGQLWHADEVVCQGRVV